MAGDEQQGFDQSHHQRRGQAQRPSLELPEGDPSGCEQNQQQQQTGRSRLERR